MSLRDPDLIALARTDKHRSYRSRKIRSKSQYEGNVDSHEETPRQISYSGHGADAQEYIQELLFKLPSHQLASQTRFITGSDNLRFRHLQHIPEDELDQAAAQLLTDQPQDVKVADIRDQYPTATLAQKKRIKRHVQEQLDQTGKQRQPLCGECGYNFSKARATFERVLRDVVYTLDLWQSSFKAIEGHFGTGVTSYFYFVRFLVLLNIPTFLLLLGFMIIPQLLYERPVELQQPPYHAQDFFTGDGWFANTTLYYGFYTNEIISIHGHSTYYMKYSYLLTTAAFYLLNVLIIMYSLSKSYRHNVIDGGNAVQLYFVNKIFSGWDHSVTSPETASLRHKTIFKELQEHLSTQRGSVSEWSLQRLGHNVLIRLVSHILVLGLLSGSGYLVWYLAKTQVLQSNGQFMDYVALPLSVATLNYILPFAFSVLGTLERYEHPQTELTIGMVRTALLIFTTLAVLVVFFFTSVDCSEISTDDRFINSDLPCQSCWEDYLGQQMYRLVVTDFFFILGTTFIAEFCRSLVARFCLKTLQKPQFNVAQNTLSLVYSQVLIWIGTFYCPYLSLMMIFKLIIIFYVKKYSVLWNCSSPLKPWRGGQTHTIILTLLFIAFLLASFLIGYRFIFLKPSESCGPYQGLNRTYDVISGAIGAWREHDNNVNAVLTVIVDILTSFFFLVALFITLCVLAHWSRVISTGYQDMVDLLKHQIQMEGKDKKFLLNLLMYTKENQALGRNLSRHVQSAPGISRTVDQVPISQESGVHI